MTRYQIVRADLERRSFGLRVQVGTRRRSAFYILVAPRPPPPIPHPPECPPLIFIVVPCGLVGC